MDIAQTKFSLKYLPIKRSILIEGPHGLGKSQCVAQTCAELSVETGKVWELIDIRLAEREVGDLIGMPRDVAKYTVRCRTFQDGDAGITDKVVENVTVNDLPAWFPRDPDSFGILFLDEIHYAAKDVLNASFELSLDRRLNGFPIPEGWRVVAAGNNNQDVYGGTTINPALYSRFLKINFEPTVPEWTDYAKKIGVHSAILQYIANFSKDLDSPEKIVPGEACPDRRSWVALSNDMKGLAEKDHDPIKDRDYLTLLAIGAVGKTVAINFVDFVKKNYKVYKPVDLLNHLTDEMVADFKAMATTEVSFYTNTLVEYMKGKGKKLTKEQGDNMEKLFLAIPKGAVSGFWIHWCKEAHEIATTWHKERKVVRDYLMEILKKSSAMAAAS